MKLLSRIFALVATVAVVVGVFTISGVGTLFAQTTAPAASTAVDFTPVVNYAIAFFAAAIAGLVAWGVQRVTGIQLTSVNQGTIETAMQNGLNLAVAKLAPNGVTLNTKSDVIAGAANYVLAHAPDAAKYFGLDGDPKALAQKLEARLVQVAPVTPAVVVKPA